jgi:hypothetical protein
VLLDELEADPVGVAEVQEPPRAERCAVVALLRRAGQARGHPDPLHLPQDVVAGVEVVDLQPDAGDAEVSGPIRRTDRTEAADRAMLARRMGRRGGVRRPRTAVEPYHRRCMDLMFREAVRHSYARRRIWSRLVERRGSVPDVGGSP